MKLSFHLLFCILLLTGCRHERVIDSVFPWPSSENPEADSLLLRIEREALASDEFTSLEKRRHPLIVKACSIGNSNPLNERLQARQLWLQAIALPYMQRKAYFADLKERGIKIDSLKYPYEYHKLLSLILAFEEDPVARYINSTENIRFFSSRNNDWEVGRNMIVAGNVMTEIMDTKKADEYSDKALEIFTKYDYQHGIRIAKSNKVRLLPSPARDSIYLEMLKDSLLKFDPASHVILLQNAFVHSDSIELLEKAIDIYGKEDVDQSNLPMVLALQAHYYTLHGDPAKGIRLLNEALDSATKYMPEDNRLFSLINSFLADSYYLYGDKDSCIEAFSEMRLYNNKYQNEAPQPMVYATDARERIAIIEKNLKLEKQRETYVLVIIILTLGIIILWLVLHLRKRRSERRYEKILMQERNERNLQSIRAQAKVMEESDRMIISIEDKIEELKNTAKLPEESAESLSRLLRIHKSNEENRQGFLKVQMELDTRFIDNLKRDFPGLPESQVKLATLIASGLDNRQIGNILNIEQASVHKSRYRLRSRLGLTKDQNLEEFLRRYNRPV